MYRYVYAYMWMISPSKGHAATTTETLVKGHLHTAISEQIEYDLWKKHDVFPLHPMFYLFQDVERNRERELVCSPCVLWQPLSKIMFYLLQDGCKRKDSMSREAKATR